MKTVKALLALEDGSVFHAESFGSPGEVQGEVIFNTAMTGYQEVLTDPSYKGQIVVMTYPLIGNYGINRTDVESARPQVEGFVVRSLSPLASNWRKEASLEEWLALHGAVAVQGVDTRALTTLLRERGALKGILSTADLDPRRLVEKARASAGLIGRDLVKEVTCQKAYPWKEELPQEADPKRPHVVAVDCGMKAHIPRMLTQAGARVTVVPAAVRAEEIFAMKPDGLFLSNGPGDPEGVPYLISTVRQCVGRLPIFGICLGHQILGLALGGRTYKLKFGHHGANHPVMDLKTGRVEITAQNHGFSVDPDSIPGGEIEITHRNLNDKTCEGMRHRKLPLFSVQYHPEASPGPHDSRYLFDRFIRMMATGGLAAVISLTVPQASSGETGESRPAAPFKISFLPAEPPAPDRPAPVVLTVQTEAKSWPASAVGDLSMELLLRLPEEGVRLESKSWTPAELPPQERSDSSGPWALFRRTVPVRVVSRKTLPSELLRETIPLRVVKEGANWIITVRARLVKGARTWETFGVLFATREGNATAFDAAPRKTRETPQAQPVR